MIADLGANHVERQALLRGFAVERVRADYGYDLLIATFNERGEAENGFILAQVKSTDRLRLLDGECSLGIQVAARDLDLWMNSIDPVILIVYDAANDRAYWLNLQSLVLEKEFVSRARPTLRIPLANMLSPESMEEFRRCRDRSLIRARQPRP